MLNNTRQALSRLRGRWVAPTERDLSGEHLAYVEKRLHVAEQTVARLESFGLIAALADPPEQYARWLTWRPPGHFYSPIPNLTELEHNADLTWPDADTMPPELPGIALGAAKQLALFDGLQDGDVLFIDSTHVVKTGNDVVWLYNEVLPRINTGVHVHIHDMFYPFEYPRRWVMEGRAWAEAYLVRAFLTDNPDFEI